MSSDTTRRARQLAALGSEIRLVLYELVRQAEGTLTVDGLTGKLLAISFPLAQPTISYHLRVLCEAGLVSYREDGLYHYYAIEAGALDDLVAWLTRAGKVAI